MFPCIGIATLTSFVFYLPSESHNKINLCISILVSLTVFFLLLIEIVPPTSIVTPLIGKYLVFTMFMVTMSVLLTVIVQNIHYRSAYPMPKYVRQIFIHFLGNYILIYRRPGSPFKSRKARYKKLPTLNALKELDNHFKQCEHTEERDSEQHPEPQTSSNIEEQGLFSHQKPKVHDLPFELRKRIQQVGSNIRYMERTLRKSRHDEDICSNGGGQTDAHDFSVTILVGTLYATISAPSVTDSRPPLPISPHY